MILNRRPQRAAVDPAGAVTAADTVVGEVLLDGKRSRATRPNRSPAHSGCCRSRRSHPTVSASPISSRGHSCIRNWIRQWTRDDEAAVVERWRDRRERTVGKARRRIVRRSASTGLDGDAAGTADRADAARRANHLPRHRLSGGSARIVRRTQTARVRAEPSSRYLCPEPRLPLRRTHHRDEGGRVVAQGKPADIVTRRLRCTRYSGLQVPASSTTPNRYAPGDSAGPQYRHFGWFTTH